MIYIVMGAIALLAIAYIVYRILDLLARRKFAQSYTAWEPDLGQYYRKQPSHPHPAGRHTNREEQEKAERLAKAMEDLLRMQGMI